MGHIDAHQHFWTYTPERDRWITDDMSILKRDFIPTELEPLLHLNHIEGCVAVQADQSFEETMFLIDIAKEYAFVKGVVGWIDLFDPDFDSALEPWKGHSELKGFRHIVQSEPKGFMLQSKFIDSLTTLGRAGYTYDILVQEQQLVEVIALMAQLPEDMMLVLDHIGKPDIKSNSFEQWCRYMGQLAKYPNLFVKLSGMCTEADWETWKPEEIIPYMEKTVELFGPKRIMYGSDWPVCLLATDYSDFLAVLHNFTDTLTAAEKEAILGGTARSFYGLHNRGIL